MTQEEIAERIEASKVIDLAVIKSWHAADFTQSINRLVQDGKIKLLQFKDGTIRAYHVKL